MPTCMRCGLTVERRNELNLVRNEDGAWEVICPTCSSEPANDSTSTPVSESGANHMAPAETSNRIKNALQAILDEYSERKTVKRTYSREHERTSTDLRVSYTLLRDDTVFSGMVRDMSRSGLRFVTDRELNKGQILSVEVETGDSEQPILRSAAEVRRVQFDSEGLYDIGVRYVRHGRVHEKNRRRYRRIKADMLAYYQRKGAECTRKAEVLDISQGGARLLFDESVQKNEEFGVILRGLGGRFVQADLCGVLRIVRVEQRSPREWVAGCMFSDVKARPRKVSAAAASASMNDSKKDTPDA